jgi:hypothetical protein
MGGTSPTGGTGTHYEDASTIVTDVTDIIFQITPEDTPFFHLIGDVPANVNAPWHQWQIRDLVTRGLNAQFEGFGYTFTGGLRLPSRQGNVLQILNKDIRVSRTNQAIGHYAINSLVADQTEVKLTELKTDIERALLCATLNTGSTATARQMQGLIPMAQNNVSMYTNGSAATFTEVLFNGFLERGWNAGAEIRDILVDGRMKRLFSNFTGNAVRFLDPQQHRLVNTISHIDTDFGPVNIHLCRDLSVTGTGSVIQGGGGSLGRAVVGIDKTHLNKAWLRPVTVRQTADIADSEDAIAVTELSLEWGIIFNNLMKEIIV